MAGMYLLRPPHIRYAHARLSPAPRSETPGPRLWTQSAADLWSFEDGLMKVRVSAAVEPDYGDGAKVITLAATALQPVRVGICEVELAFACERPPLFVDRFLRLAILRGSASVNDYSPMFIRWCGPDGQINDLRNASGFCAHRLAYRENCLRVAVLLDAAALHPRWRFRRGRQSEAAPRWQPGQSVAVRLVARIAANAEQQDAVVPGRFPAGAQAALSLTDHCDFDTEDRLKVFLYGSSTERGWLGRGLRLTKSAFAFAGNQPATRPAATLGSEGYRALIQALRDDGSEIVPHSLNEWGSLDPFTFTEQLERFAAEWKPRTWIDHGYLPYNYSSGGADDLCYRLLDRLTDHGFVALSSSHDIPADARGSLNMFAPPRGATRPVAVAVWRHLRQGRFGIALRYVRAVLRPHLEGAVGYLLDGALLSLTDAVKGPRRFVLRHWIESWGISWRRLKRVLQAGPTAFKVAHTRAELLDVAAVIYPERAVPLNQATPDDLLLFTTLEAIHTKDIYSPRSLQRLIEERGLHVGHCYLLNELSYIAGIFERGAAARRLSAEWQRFADALCEEARNGRLWNPTVSDLVQYVRDIQQVALRLASDGRSAVVTNRSPRPMRDFTLLLPKSTVLEHVTWSGTPPAGFMYWSDWLAVWGPVPAHGSALVAWSRPRGAREAVPTATATAAPCEPVELPAAG